MITLEIAKTTVDTIIKFNANKVLTKGSHQYNNIDEAKESPLAQQLFYLPFVKRIFISANFIAIERFSIVSWEDVQEEVKEQIENFLNDGGVLISSEVPQKKVPVEVYAESTPNPETMKFVANKLLIESDIEFIEFKNKAEAKDAPLALALFDFPFVKELFISKNYISVTRNASVEWDDIVVELRSFVKNYLAEGKKVITKTMQVVPTEETNVEVDIESLDDISKEIVKVLDEYIKPAVASDGGNIAFQSYDKETKILSVVLQGACSGCPSSTITLKNGIQNTLQQLLPGAVNEVVATNQ
ncbi:MAG: NifU family protein [Flavobacteriaceae bacterium]|nr:NifU family protein [Flavobacteriaceae bacterium]